MAKNVAEAASLANEIAPEHLQLALKDPHKAMEPIRNAGAIFLGNGTPEACGDYLAGPSHVLPTSGSARFSSPLGVTDFLKTTSLISFDPKALEKFGPTIIRIAEMEGLDGHANSVRLRLGNKLPKKD